MSFTTHTTVRKVNAGAVTDTDDQLANEEPLEIRLDYMDAGKRVQKSISVTMRTPGNDFELAAGFLFTEGVIHAADDVISIKYVREDTDNIVLVTLRDDVAVPIANLERNFYTTSSCGVCGKASIEAVRVACSIPDVSDSLRISAATICRLPDELRTRQEVFKSTGGLHACGLFTLDGKLIIGREDIGRHNALDKLIGAMLIEGHMPLDKHILLLSGRASFELIQKAIMAGVKIVAAVGAPSSLAAEMAEEWGITLVGFLRGERFNIYSGAERVVILQP
jgi:FdhD protein